MFKKLQSLLVVIALLLTVFMPSTFAAYPTRVTVTNAPGGTQSVQVYVDGTATNLTKRGSRWRSDIYADLTTADIEKVVITTNEDTTTYLAAGLSITQDNDGDISINLAESTPGGNPGGGGGGDEPGGSGYIFEFGDLGSSGIQLFYSANGELPLLEIGSNSTISFDADDIGSIMFYVKVMDGYDPTTLNVNFVSSNQNGDLFDTIGDYPSLRDARTGSYSSYVAANTAASDLGCIKEFHYSVFARNAGYDLRTFIVTASPLVGSRYTVTYNANGGSGTIIDNNSPYYAGNRVTVLGNTFTAPANHHFVGFNTMANGNGVSYAAGDRFTINSNVTLYAMWEENAQFTVIYIANGGTGSMLDSDSPYYTGSTVTVLGNSFTAPANHHFVGFNTKSDGTGVSHTAGETFTITENVRLYAIWAENAQFTVTYVANGGTGSMLDSDSPYYTGSTVTVLGNSFTAPANHHFVGFNTMANGNGVSYAAGDRFTINSNVTLYAMWEENAQFTVIYIANGGTGSMLDSDSPYYTGSTVTVLGNSFTAPANHHFVGFNTKSDGTGVSHTAGETFTITENVRLYAIWAENAQFTVTYVANGGTGSMLDSDSPYYTGSTVTVLGNSFTAPANHHFVGFNTMANGNGVSYAVGDRFTINSNVTLYAIWAENAQFTVTYVANGGTGSMLDSDSPYYTGSTVTVLGNSFTAPANHHFVGFNTMANGNGVSYAAGETFTITENVRLYAIWAENAKFTVTYVANGGSGTMIDNNSPYYTGSTVTVLGNSFTAPANHHFVGFNTKSDGTGTDYTVGETFTITENVRLYAIWAENAQFTVTYVANGGTGSMLDSDSPYYTGSTVTVLGNAFTAPANHHFVGFNTKSDGTGTDYTVGETFTIIGNVTLYAMWEENAKFTVIYIANGGTGSMTDDDSPYYTVSTVTVLGNSFTAPANHHFVGFNTKSDGTGTDYTVGETFTIIGNVTLYAMWEENAKFTVIYIANGGTGSMTDDDSPYYTGSTVTVLGNSFTAPANHYFVGFNTMANGNGVSYAAGETFTITGNVTLYAMWAQKTLITINPSSASFDFDKTEKSVTTYTTTGLPTGYTLHNVTVLGKGTNVNQYTVSVTSAVSTFIVRDAANVDVTEQFSFATTTGTLTIKPAKITITANSESRAYNGLPLTNSGYSITSGQFYGTDGFATVTVKGSVTFVGTDANEITAHTFTAGTVAANYTVSYADGLLEITPILTPIVITTDGSTRDYNGEALVNAGFSYTQGVLVTGDVLTVVTNGTQLNVGGSDNTIASYAVMRGVVDVTANYTFGDSVLGELVVTPAKITITANSESRAYNGLPLTNSGYSITSGQFYGTDGFATVTVEGSVMFVGTDANEITAHTFTAGTVAANYTVSYADGLLEITPILTPISIIADSASRIYNGLLLTETGYSYTQGVLVEGDILTVNITGSQLNVGSSNNEIVYYAIMRDGVNVTANYTIGDITDGTLTVTPRTVTITGNRVVYTYNGNPQEVMGIASINGLIGNHVLTGVNVVAQRTDVGTTPAPVTGTPRVITPTGTVVTGNYRFVYNNGSITINPLEVVIRINDDTKVTGEEDPTFTSNVNGEIEQGDIVFTYDREDGEEVGTYPITAIVTDNPNYVVTVIEGVLTITAEDIPEPPTPLDPGSSWAWVNLVLTIITGLGSLFMIGQYIFGGKGKDEKKGKKATKRSAWRIASLIPVIAAIVAFILTEDVTLDMVAVDKWTILMAGILVVQIVFFMIIRQDKYQDDKDEKSEKSAK